MKKLLFKKLEDLYERFLNIQNLLTKKKIIANKKKFFSLSCEYSKLFNICKVFENWKKIKNDIVYSKELLTDPEFHDLAFNDLKKLLIKKKQIKEKLKSLLTPEDENNNSSGCVMEIRSATGGDEAAIFASDLFRMYNRYAEENYWKIKVLNIQHSSQGGFKEIICKIIGKNVFKKLKFESGGHRVQRVPKTETQGRLHTSTCTVAIMPIIKKSKFSLISLNDLKIDTFRSSGAGGQHVNTTDSAVRITHLPTGIVSECQDERSQHKNKAKALFILSTRVYNAKMIESNKKNDSLRKNLLGTGERSDRNRTYNFPKNRVTDHRINLNLFCLNKILEGKLDLIIKPLTKEYQSNFLLNNLD